MIIGIIVFDFPYLPSACVVRSFTRFWNGEADTDLRGGLGRSLRKPGSNRAATPDCFTNRGFYDVEMWWPEGWS